MNVFEFLQYIFKAMPKNWNATIGFMVGETLAYPGSVSLVINANGSSLSWQFDISDINQKQADTCIETFKVHMNRSPLDNVSVIDHRN